MSDAAALLDSGALPGYLVERGVLESAAGVRVAELSGGVSSAVFAVESGSDRLVVKQALPRLRVRAEWLAKRDRALTEGAALELAGKLVPDTVPALRDVDPGAFALTMEHAPGGWRPWKEALLAGEVDTRVAAALGRLLGEMHAGTLGSESVASRFDDAEAFRQLRLHPYYSEIARVHPLLRGAVGACAAAVSFHRRCLVHGDFSPKNVLVGTGGLWVVDWEVAHWGDPAFDIAFMLHHLVLKAVHRPEAAGGLAAAADQFWRAYAARAPALATEQSYVLCHVGCLLVARVDGKSPAEYLTAPQQAQARRLGTDLMSEPAATLAELWRRLEPAR